ncbi:hypothetical protein D9M71_373740 [compost metagenome]
MLDHRAGNYLGTGGQVSLQADQLLFEQGQGLGHAHQHPVERALPVGVGGNEWQRVESLAITHQVFFQRQASQVRVAAAGDLQVAAQADRQGPEAVIEHQHAGTGIWRLLGQMLQQVLVGSVEGLQGIVGLLGLAKQIELGEGAGQQGHGVRL